MHTKNLLVGLALGLGLTLGLLIGLHTAQAAPAASPWFAEPGGSGTLCTQAAPCTPQTALDQAASGDTLYLASGTYTSAETAILKITKSITLYGGWDNSPSGPVVLDPIQYPTTLDGQNARRAVTISGTISVRLEGLGLQRGNASGLGGDPFGFDVGGALYANGASLVISSCRITSSTAQFGGGLALYHGTPALHNSLVLSNTASRGGGGVFLYQNTATVSGNTVVDNLTAGYGQYEGGGGLYLDASLAIVQGNVITGNTGQPHGGGMYLYASPAIVRGNTIQKNTATSDGGGVFMLYSPAELHANLVLDNFASTLGGGAAVMASAPFTMTNNVFALNQTGLIAGALLIAGQSYGIESRGALLHNTFVLNHAAFSPYMIHLGYGSGTTATVAFTNTIISLPGGVFVEPESTARLDTTLWEPAPIVGGTGTIISNTNLTGFLDLIWPTFHIGPNSAAINQGAGAGVLTDVDGEARPNGPQPDVGADEFYCYALAGVNIAGPTTVISGAAAAFTATVSPPTATSYVTYTWQASGQSPLVHTPYRLSDMAAFTWTITGTQTITVTAANCGGSAVDTHVVTVRSLWQVYLPLVLRNP